MPTSRTLMPTACAPAVVTALLLFNAACGREPDAVAPPANGPESTSPPSPDDPAAAPEMAPQDTAPRREVDWSLLEKDPFATRLGRWDEFAAAETVCMSADNARCREMRRALNRVADQSEIGEVIGAVRQAFPTFVRLWSDEFDRLGATFTPPTFSYYGAGTTTGVFSIPEQKPPECPPLWENALYCPTTRAIYYDAVYLARIAAAVRETDGTSGRYAALSVAAHELGHAVQFQTGDWKAPLYRQELLADCFAGAAMAAVARTEAGSQAAPLAANPALSEGQLGLYLVGGPVMRDDAHEAGPVRADFFTRGFNRGVSACSEAFNQ
jgi:predicted metalloprotease